MSQISTVPKMHVLGGNCATIPAVESLENLVRRRVLALFERPQRTGAKWTLERLASFLGMKDSSGVRKILSGENRISLAHVQGFCEAFQVTPSELMTSEGATFVYLKESEPMLIQLFREMDAHQRHSLMVVLQWRPGIVIGKGRKARIGLRELTEEQQLVVDLYVRSEPQAREGVLKVLRGTAKAYAKAGRSPSPRTSE